jgi:hypothetical protein
MKNDARILMTCKGICIRQKASRPASNGDRYSTGQKRCQVCEIFLKWEGCGVPAVDIGSFLFFPPDFSPLLAGVIPPDGFSFNRSSKRPTNSENDSPNLPSSFRRVYIFRSMEIVHLLFPVVIPLCVVVV